MIVYLKLIFCR